MIRKLTITSLLALTGCFISLISSSIDCSAQAHAQSTKAIGTVQPTNELLTAQHPNTHTRFVLDDLMYLPCPTSLSSINTFSSKIWGGNMWIKTWLWSQIRQ